MSTLIKSFLMGALACGLPALATAQTWQLHQGDSGALISASAFAPGGSLMFHCTTPSPQGRPLIETGDHEAQRTDMPFTMIVSVGDTLLDPYADNSTLAQPRMTLDGTTYGLPAMPWDELFWNWSITLSMQDPLFGALLATSDLVFDPSRGTAYRYPTDGLSPALAQAIGTCASGWMAAGNAPSPALQGLFDSIGPAIAMGNAAPAAAPVANAVRPGEAPDPDRIPLRRPQPFDTASITFSPPMLPAVPGTAMYARAVETANLACGSPASLRSGAVWAGNIDGDGIEDIVLNWGFVTCPATADRATGLPGVCDTNEQCTHTLFASAQTNAGQPDTHLQALHAEPDPAGPAPLFFSTLTPICQGIDIGFGCTGWLRWTGTGFQPTQVTALQSDQTNFQAEVFAQPDRGAPPQGYAWAPAMQIPDQAPDAAEAHIRGQCQGDYEISDFSAVQATDIDGDGQADYVLNWSGVECYNLPGRVFCGAANCSIDVFLSSRGYANPEQLLGISALAVQDGQGRVGVLLNGTPFVCADGFCDSPFYWNGATLAQ